METIKTVSKKEEERDTNPVWNRHGSLTDRRSVSHDDEQKEIPVTVESDVKPQVVVAIQADTRDDEQGHWYHHGNQYGRTVSLNFMSVCVWLPEMELTSAFLSITGRQ